LKDDCGNGDFRPFIPECERRGISKSVAYELKSAGLLETFSIGRSRYVLLQSLDTLPQRLIAKDGAE
jgi:hypothetical protein